MILVLLFILGVLAALAAFSTLCAVGWKRKSDEAIKSANYNAELWAASEAQKHGLEIENARLQGQNSENLRAFVAMSRIASEAIQTSAVNNNLSLPTYPDSDDAILNAQDIE